MARAARLGGRSALAGTALAIAMTVTLGAGQAAAQANDCAAAGPMMIERQKLMQRIEGFRKKRPSAVEACNVFTSLSGNGSRLIPWVETNGAWCHVPPEFLPNLKAQQEQMSKVRGQACTAAVQQKKLEAQARRQQQGQKAPGPLGGGDEIVGGPIRMPQGAL
ncbi:MAG: hypothetical protein ACOYOJ_07910 [Alsobacter sp.]